jgi:hypothetical protein
MEGDGLCLILMVPSFQRVAGSDYFPFSFPAAFMTLPNKGL